MTSPSGFFYAFLTAQGEFIVARGDPSTMDKPDVLWSSQSAQPKDSNTYEASISNVFFAIMRQDGELIFRVVGQGAPPSDDWTPTVRLEDDGALRIHFLSPNGTDTIGWTSNATDPVADVVEIKSIDYDVANAVVSNPTPEGLYSQTVTNDSDHQQTSSVTGSVNVELTSGWSDSLAVKVGVSTTFSAGIPAIASGKVTVSLDVTNTYTWNGSSSTSQSFGFNTPVTVDPHTTVEVLIVATQSTITVPYVLTGKFTLQSGTAVQGTIHGMYTGTDSHDLTVKYVNQGQDDFTARPLLPSELTRQSH
jgi:hypothetical protein